MRITRVYSPISIPLHTPILLEERIAHHLINVLRLRSGHMLTVFNGDGFDYIGTISKIEKRQVWFTAEASQSIEHRESVLKTHLGQAISKGEKMDFVIQKSVELGVTEITPLITEYCNIKLDEERRSKRHEHWQRVAISAAEQSGRPFVPKIHPPCLLSDFLTQAQSEDQNIPALKLIFHCRHAKPFSEILNLNKNINNNIKNTYLIIGPEGGFTDKEIANAGISGFQPITLGPRILRTETAPITALSLLQFYFGDLNSDRIF